MVNLLERAPGNETLRVFVSQLIMSIVENEHTDRSPVVGRGSTATVLALWRCVALLLPFEACTRAGWL